MRILATASLACVLLMAVACGGGNSSKNAANGTLTGNWQINLVQQYPVPVITLSVSGFLVGASDAVTGSVEGPNIVNAKGVFNCGGIGQLTGTLNAQNVNFSVNDGGSIFTFTGTISSDSTTMSGDYTGQGGACFTRPTSGTWTASLVPAVNGNFSGTLSGSSYMAALTGVSPAAPIEVTGTMTQSENFGASNASVTGTISASGYPCFATAALTGTISGENVNLAVFGYDGTQIGTLTNATAAPGSSGMEITGALTLGKSSSTTTVGPCPPLNGGSGNQIGDSTVVALTFQ